MTMIIFPEVALSGQLFLRLIAGGGGGGCCWLLLLFRVWESVTEQRTWSYIEVSTIHSTYRRLVAQNLII